MKMYTKTLHESNEDISLLVAQNHKISKNLIFPFANNCEFLTELFLQYDCDGINLISIGTTTPEVLIASDKANMKVNEYNGTNPFAYSLENTLDEITDGDIIYIANPNKISGANFSLTGLKKIAEKNSEGLIIIDEYYFDFYGITGLPLLESYSNIVILRSFTASFGIYSSDAGYAISSKVLTLRFKEIESLRPISTILRKTILATMANSDVSQTRLQEIRDEALRISKSLTSLGVQSRITATDFLLIRVSSPKDVGNYLQSNKIAVENLSGYPSMKHYVRFRIESYFSNNRFIKAFESMPTEFFKFKQSSKQSITLKRAPESIEKPKTNIDEILNSKVKDRSSLPNKINEKHLFKISN